MTKIVPAARGVVLDMDGVIYRGSTVLPGARAFLAALRRRGVPYWFLTNNSSQTPADYQRKLHGMGIEAAADQVLTSAVAVQHHLRRQDARGRALIIGEGGLREAAAGAGLSIVDEAPAEFVIAGLDRRFSYDRLRAAALAIHGGATFIASNRDPNIPVEEALWPGGGAIVAAIETASGARPVVCGKPETLLFEMAAERAGLRPGDMVMIGDQISTDIDGGERAGMRTVLVLTGVSTAAEAARRPVPPTLVVPDLERLLALWEDDA